MEERHAIVEDQLRIGHKKMLPKEFKPVKI